MARQPTPQINPVQLQPVATPVDTFVQPQALPRGNNLQDLAQSLGGVSAALSNYMDLKAAQQKKDDDARAKADSLAGRSQDLAEGIRQGKIPPQYSPQYVATFKQTQGQLAGGNLQEKWNTYFQQGTWKDDPSDSTYDDHLKAFLKDNLGSDDPQVLQGQLPYVQQLIDNSRSQWISYHANKLQTDSLNAGGALANQQTQQALRDGLSSPKGTNYDAIWTNLASKRDAFIQAGHTADDWDSMIMKQMSVVTLQSQDPNMLKFFDQKVPGKDFTYGDTPEGAKIKLQTLDSLKTAVGENYSRTHAIEEQQRKDNLNTALSNIGRTLAANPMATIDESVLRQAEDSGRPLIRTELNDMRGNLLKGNSDPTRMQGVLTDILMNPNEDPVQTVMKAAQQGVYGRPEDMQSAITFAQSFKNNQDKLRVAMEMPVAKKWNDLFTKQTSNVNDFGDPISGVSNAGNEAMFDFRRMVNEWMVGNPNATQQQIDEQVDKVGKSISDRFTPNPDATGFGTRPAPQLYGRDPNLSFDNPFAAGSPNALMNPGVDQTDPSTGLPGKTQTDAPAVGGAITPNNPKGASTAAPQQAAPQALPNGAPVVAPSDKQVKAFIDKMPQDQQDRMKKALQFVPGGDADKKMQDYIRQYLTKQPGLIPASYDPNSPDYGQGDTRASGGLSADEANDYITQAVAAAKDMGGQGGSTTSVSENLKSLIGYTESNGNYNAIFGDANSKQDLGQLSVDQVLAAQQAMRQRGVDSTAVGKYGIIYGTLKSLKAEGIVDGSEPFNKVTQDKMADALLARRGLHDYLNGSLSQRQFALRLSQEWAALPSPNTGQSYYEGDGLNHSRIKPSAVYSAMGMVPASYTPDANNNGFGGERGDGAGNENFGQYNPVAKPLPQGDLSWDGRKQTEVDGLAIHHTGGNTTVQGVVDTLNKRGLGVQYIMDRDGTIYQTAPDGARFSHILTAKNGSGLNNNNAVGIEIIANDDSDVTPAQKASAQRWIDSMRQRYPNIGTNVFGHGELNPGHKEASEGMSVVNEFRRRTSPQA